MGWQRASGYNWRTLVEADTSRWKRVMVTGCAHRRMGGKTEVAIAAKALN